MRFVFVLLLWAAALPVAAGTMNGVVIVVIDGDSVLFKPDHYSDASRAFMKIRLADIDAPEKDQPYGDAATRALSALVLKQRVELTTVATDSYGRTLARIRLGEMPVNAELVRRGAAWASGYRRNAELLETQREARRARLGLWGEDAPTPPWVWRRQGVR